MVGVLGDEHLRQRPLGRQPALDEVCRRGRLHEALLTGPAGALRAHRDQHPQLRRNDVQPLATVFADAHHLSVTAGTLRAVGSMVRSDTRQVLGQVAQVALRGRALPGRRRRCAWRGGGLCHRSYRALFWCLGLGEALERRVLRTRQTAWRVEGARERAWLKCRRR